MNTKVYRIFFHFVFMLHLCLEVSCRARKQQPYRHHSAFPILISNEETSVFSGETEDFVSNGEKTQEELKWLGQIQPKKKYKSKRSMEKNRPYNPITEIDYDEFMKRVENGKEIFEDDIPTSTERMEEHTSPLYFENGGYESTMTTSTEARIIDEILYPDNEILKGNIKNNHHQSNTINSNKPSQGINVNEGSKKLYGQNLVIFGHVEQSSFIRRIKECSAYTQVDLFSKYRMSELASNFGSPYGQLLLYFNLIELDIENYEIALEKIKRILDHFTVTYQGLAMFSVLHSQENEDVKSKRFMKLDTKYHWKVNDAVMSYCSVDYPRCHVIPDLSTITKALNDSYIKDQTLEEYDSKRYSKFHCLNPEDCPRSPIQLEEFFTLSDLSPEKQLQKFQEVFCGVSYHRVIEFSSKFPSHDDDFADPVPTQSSGRMGLVLNDILPLDLKQYDKNQPPRFEGQSTTVYFHVTVLSVDSINEESMTYVTDIFLAQSWRDHRLRLPENMTEEYRILDVEWLQKMWRPDCFFKNAKRVTFHEMSVPNHYLWFYHDKTLLYMAKLTLVLSCAMKFESYPHDTQICSMMIESLSHTTHDLVFKWNETDPLVVNPDIELPQLDISRNYTEDCTLNYSTGNFTCLAVVFNLRRRLGYHLFHTYVPSALTVVMSWISFWIKPEAIPARVTLGVTSLLTLATQNQQSQSSLPPVSYIKAIDVWMSSCTVFVFASLLQFGIVNHFMNDMPSTKDMTGFSLDDITSAFDDRKNSEDTELVHRSRSKTRGRSPGAPQYVVTRCSGKDIAIYIDRFSRYFFPFSFLVLNISYWSIYGM